MNIDIWAGWLDRINSATKYPSILTYHELERGTATELLTRDDAGNTFPPEGKYLTVTEKIDGENFRIIIHDDFVLVGTREQIIYVAGDFPCDQRIIRFPDVSLFERAKEWRGNKDTTLVIYGEYYGDKIQQTKYTQCGARGFRVFDVAEIPKGIVSYPKECISQMRERDGYFKWYDLGAQDEVTDALGIKRVPFRKQFVSNDMPHNVRETKAWLEQFRKSFAGLDRDEMKIDAEGVVVRTFDRKWIRKIRFDDYKRVP